MGFLKGKTAIITGAGRAVLSDGRCGSIGYGIATAYAKEGANLVITGRNVAKLESAKIELEEKYGVKVLILAADINETADNEAIAKMVVNKTIEEFGRIDVLINNAGVLDEGLKAINHFDDDVLEKVININQKGTMYCMRAAVKIMAEKQSGSIVNVASVAGYNGGGGAA